MILTLYIALVCYMPILGNYLPRTNFGSGMPDIGIDRVITYLLLMAFVIEAALRHRIKLFSKWTLILGIYSIIVLASVSWSPLSYNLRVLQSIFDTVFVPLFVAVIALTLFKEKGTFGPFGINITISAFILSIMSIYQMATGSSISVGELRSAATLGNPNALAIVLVLILPFIIYSIENDVIPKLLAWPICSVVATGIICTVSRKGIGTAILCFFIYYFLKGKKKKMVVLLSIVGIMALILAGYSVVSERFSRANLDHSYSYKLKLVSAGLKMYATSPIIGLGYNGYYETLPVYLGTKYDAHNIFITALTNYGMLGFIPFLGIFMYPLSVSYKILRKKNANKCTDGCKDMAIICICSVIPFMISGYFGGGLFYQPQILYLFYTNIALVLVSWDRLPKGAQAQASDRH